MSLGRNYCKRWQWNGYLEKCLAYWTSEFEHARILITPWISPYAAFRRNVAVRASAASTTAACDGCLETPLLLTMPTCQPTVVHNKNTLYLCTLHIPMIPSGEYQNVLDAKIRRYLGNINVNRRNCGSACHACLSAPMHWSARWCCMGDWRQCVMGYAYKDCCATEIIRKKYFEAKLVTHKWCKQLDVWNNPS